jgi:hypothetical protein
MIVYGLRYRGNDYNGLRLPPDCDNYDFVCRFEGERWGDAWVPIPVRTEHAHDGRRAKNRDGDYPALHPAIPVVSQRALDVLRPLISNFVEVLPLQHPTDRYYIIHVLEILDCLDQEKSEGERGSSGRLYQVEKYVWKPGVIDETKHIFKIKGLDFYWPFVSASFKRLVDENGLLGFGFLEVGPDGALRSVVPPEKKRARKR